MSNIVIVGLGALGSHAALALRNMKLPIKLVDFDRVESKNTLSQFHSRMGAGQNKAQALKTTLQGLWGLKVDTAPVKLTDDNATQLLGGASLVLDCTDNIAARTTMQKFCKKQDIPLMHGAISADGSFARVVWSEWFVADAESGDGATCEDGANLPFHVLAGSLLAMAAQAFLTKGRKVNYQATPTGVVTL